MPELLTRIAVRPGGPGLPVRLRLDSSLLACRAIGRDERGAQVALLAGGAMLLGGDRVRVEIEVADRCLLRLTDIGGTVAYGSDGRPAAFDVEVRLGVGATLEWEALPLIVADGADVTRSSRVLLEAGAVLRLRETVVLGRSGERGGRVTLRNEVTDPEGPVFVEQILLDGEHPVPGVAAGIRVLDSLLLVGGDHAGDAEALTAAAPVGRPTLLRLDRAGSVLRWLGVHTHESPFDRVGLRPVGSAAEPCGQARDARPLEVIG